MTDDPGVSVVIPALDEESSIADAVLSARAAGADEVVVVDGGSSDGTAAAGRSADRVLEARRGRGSQMNAGARAARGDILLFLHADTRLPAGAIPAVRSALRDPSVVGGAFSVVLAVSPDAAAGMRAVLRATGRMIGVRSRIFRTYTGDQAIFVRRDVFGRIGGFPDWPLMEDVEFSRRLALTGGTVLLPLRVATSARRWEDGGPLRTILLMWYLRLAFRAGMTPARCAAIYGRRGSRRRNAAATPRPGGAACRD